MKKEYSSKQRKLWKLKRKNDVWWNNTSTVNKLFNDLCETVLEDQEYFKSMFKLCTEYVINESLKELNNLIDYTEYWTGE